MFKAGAFANLAPWPSDIFLFQFFSMYVGFFSILQRVLLRPGQISVVDLAVSMEKQPTERVAKARTVQ